MKQSKRTPISLLVLTLLGLWMLVSAPAIDTTIKISTDSDIFKIAEFGLNAQLVSAIAFAFQLLATGYSSFFVLVRKHKTPRFVVLVFGLALVVEIMILLFAGKTMTITSLLQGSLALAVPLIFGSLAGVLSERVGVVNIAIEGQLLAGAFISALVASLSANMYLGLIGAIIAGALVSWVLAVFSIKYIVDQIIVGVVLNVLVVGVTNFLFSTLMVSNLTVFNQPPRFEKILIPLLGQIPVIGPVLFNQTLIVYLMYLSVAGIWFALFKTRWGLRLRAVGEYPKAADTVGIKVFRTRYISVIIGGAFAGLGGAFFTLGQVGSFGKEMTNGAGYIALAALIFGRWNPIYAAFAGLLFGFAQNLQYGLAIIGSPVPSEFLLMLPYALTVIAVAGLVGKVTGPAASGKAYIKS
ncbi:ABC transporter permease [Rhodoluna sp.]|uniref:ABC transporter permease n=1 Tax=Rhodoluna sp. TaxID=1969481 RepID=UPI0025CD76AC|nr:ABC transporter permease [Rhodoluna sp.]